MKKQGIIFKNQQYTSDLLLNDTNKFNNLLLIAEPQSGKTGVLVDFTYKLSKKYFNNCNVRSYIPSDLTLKEQITERFKDTYYNLEGFENKNIKLNSRNIDIYYPSNLHSDRAQEEFKLKIDEDRLHAKDYEGALLHIHDEAHRDVNKKGIFHEIFETNKIPYLFTEHFVQECNELTLLCTATPSPQIEYAKKCLRENDKMPFAIRYLSPGENYVGLEHLYNAGRIKQSYKLFEKNQPTADLQKFKDEVILKFIADSKSKPGYGIIRLNSDKEYKLFVTEITDYSSTLNFNIPIKIYNCENKNIDQLNEDIKKSTNTYQICVIIDSYLQGKTFDDLSNVRFWFDTFDKNQNNDVFIAQSVGRNCGYFKDKNYEYTVYTDVVAVLRLINFYNKIKVINEVTNNDWIFELPPMTGTYIKIDSAEARRNKLDYEWHLFFHDSIEDRNNDADLENKLGFNPSVLSLGATLSKNINKKSVDIVSHIANKNFPKIGGARQKTLLNDKKDKGIINVENTDIYCGTILLDDPTSFPDYQFHDSWQKFVKTEKNSIIYNAMNKYITYVQGNKVEKNEIITKEDTSSLYAINNIVIQDTQEINDEIVDDLNENFTILKYNINDEKYVIKSKDYIQAYLEVIRHILSTFKFQNISLIINDLQKNVIISRDRNFFTRRSGEFMEDLYVRQIKINENDLIYINSNNCTGTKDKNLQKIYNAIKKIDKDFNLKITRNEIKIV